MNEENRQGFDIVINRSVYACETDSPVVSRVFGGRGRMTVGELVEKRALTVSLIFYHLMEHPDFTWSGIMPLVSAGAPNSDADALSKGVARLRHGKFYGPSENQPCIVWAMGNCWHGDGARFHFTIPRARAEAIVRLYPDPIYSLDEVIQMSQMEVS